MSLNTIETAYTNGQIIDASHINELTLSLLGEIVGRDSAGVPTPTKSLGTLAIPWGNIYADGIILNGRSLDVSQVTANANRIISGETTTLSSMPAFLLASTENLSFKVLGTSVPLILSINNTVTAVTEDVIVSGIVAAPALNNTARINDAEIMNDLYAGEESTLHIDEAGSEITNLIGQVAAFLTPAGEIFKCFVKSATELTKVFRGNYFGNANAPVPRRGISNNDLIKVLKLSWVFANDNGTTFDVTNLTPEISFRAPRSPTTGQYWFDLPNKLWKRYSGVSFEVVDRILIGEVVSNETSVIAVRCADFSKQFRPTNNVETKIESTEIIESTNNDLALNVYGEEIGLSLTGFSWNITTDLENPLVELASTVYYNYISDEGEPIISSTKPFSRKDLKGDYHPFQTWRCLGSFFNDANKNIVRSSDQVKKNSEILVRGFNSYGSTFNKVRRFATLAFNNGMSISYEDSATLGGGFTILKTGKYNIMFNGTGSGTIFTGLSVNTTQGSSSIEDIRVEDRLLVSGSYSTVATATATITVNLKKGDVIRGHTRGNGGGDGRVVMLRITEVE